MDELKELCDKICDVQGSLKGLSALCKQSPSDICLSGEELFGIGQILDSFSKELEEIENKVRSILS